MERFGARFLTRGRYIGHEPVTGWKLDLVGRFFHRHARLCLRFVHWMHHPWLTRHSFWNIKLHGSFLLLFIFDDLTFLLREWYFEFAEILVFLQVFLPFFPFFMMLLLILRRLVRVGLTLKGSSCLITLLTTKLLKLFFFNLFYLDLIVLIISILLEFLMSCLRLFFSSFTLHFLLNYLN